MCQRDWQIIIWIWILTVIWLLTYITSNCYIIMWMQASILACFHNIIIRLCFYFTVNGHQYWLLVKFKYSQLFSFHFIICLYWTGGRITLAPEWRKWVPLHAGNLLWTKVMFVYKFEHGCILVVSPTTNFVYNRWSSITGYSKPIRDWHATEETGLLPWRKRQFGKVIVPIYLESSEFQSLNDYSTCSPSVSFA